MQAQIRTLKSQFRNIPILRDCLRQRSLRRRFGTELQLLKGTHRNHNEHPSIIHFSVDKAATQYTKNILKRCASQNKLVTVSIHDYAFNTEFPYLHELSAQQMQNYKHIFKPNGYLYSVFGGMVEGIGELEKYVILLMLRDPRDVLVSEYYSIAYNHVAPYRPSAKYDEFISQRRTAQSMTIDEYVIKDSDRLYEILHRYKRLLIDTQRHVYVTTYEKMLADFQRWLTELLDRCGLPITNEFREALVQEHERMRPKEEDVRRHLRKGQAEDYKEKLKKETIDYLDRKFASILEEFGYDQEGHLR
jgi:hypothetical protein